MDTEIQPVHDRIIETDPTEKNKPEPTKSPVNIAEVALKTMKKTLAEAGKIEPLSPLEQYAYTQATSAIQIETEFDFKCSMSWSDGVSKIQLENCIDPILVEAVLDYIHEHQGSAA
jgi:hypothetical protein